MYYLTNKAILGFVGAVTTVGIVATAAGGSASKEELKTIRTLLSAHQPNKRLLLKEYKGVNNGSSQEGKDAGKQYRIDHKDSNKDPFSLLKTKPVSVSEENATEDFMSACASLFDEKVVDTESERYKLADKYCTTLISVSDLVGESNHRVLDTVGDGSSTEGKGLWKKYRENNLNKESGADEGKLSTSQRQWTGSVEAQESAPENFRSKCKDESGVKTIDKESDSYLNVLKYCSVSRQT